MPDNLYETLYAEGLLSDASFARLRQKRQNKLFSIHWEVRTLLYAGILLLTSGLGLLIYENIDTVGHQFVLMLIAAISLGCFYYCFKNKLPFSTAKVKAPTTFFDYILLLGCISFLTFVGYLQFEYKVFGLNYGLATLIPMLVLFFVAYAFDHLGILSMAIINLALWMGVSLTPKELLLRNDFDNQTIIFTYLVLGVILVTAAYLTQRFHIKEHFKFSYQHYGVHVLYLSLLAGYFHFYEAKGVCLLFILGVFLFSYLLYQDAMRHRSFYFSLLVVLYSYFALCCLIVRLGAGIVSEGVIELLFLYFMASGVGMILLLIHLHKKIKAA